MDAQFFKLSSIFLLFNAFLANAKFPNGLNCAKEQGLWISIGLICVLTSIKIVCTKGLVIRFKLVDVLITLFLIFLPICYSFYVQKDININAILNQTSFGFAYLSLRILSYRIKPIVLVNSMVEILTIVLFFHLLISLAQYSGLLPSYYPQFGVTGMFFNPGPFAIFTVSLESIAAAVLIYHLKSKKLLLILFYSTIVIISTFFVVNSFSRSAWMAGIIVILAVALFWFNARINRYFKEGNFRFIYILLVLFLVFICLKFYELKVASANGRLLAWKVTTEMIKDHWVWGVGPGKYSANFVNYQSQFFKQDIENIRTYGMLAGDNRFAFNDLLQIFAEKGMIGLLLFILILWQCYKLTKRILSNNKNKVFIVLGLSCTAVGIVTILIAGITSYPLMMLPIAILFWFLITILVTLDGDRSPVKKMFPFLNIGVTALFLLIGAGYLYRGVSQFNAFTKWVQIAERPHNSIKKVDMLLSLYKKLNTEPIYLNSIADIYISNKMYAKAIPYLERATMFSPDKEYCYKLGTCYEACENYGAASKQYLKISYAIPHLLKPKYLLTKMYYAIGDYDSFEKNAKIAIYFQPKIKSQEVLKMKNDLLTLLRNLHSEKIFNEKDETIY